MDRQNSILSINENNTEVKLVAKEVEEDISNSFEQKKTFIINSGEERQENLNIDTGKNNTDDSSKCEYWNSLTTANKVMGISSFVCCSFILTYVLYSLFFLG